MQTSNVTIVTAVSNDGDPLRAWREAMPTFGPCIVCNEQTSRKCGACYASSHGQNPRLRFYFCSIACQAVAWPNHKLTCPYYINEQEQVPEPEPETDTEPHTNADDLV
jgi:hypothetical protein